MYSGGNASSSSLSVASDAVEHRVQMDQGGQARRLRPLRSKKNN
jgi:hypothetical protein